MCCAVPVIFLIRPTVLEVISSDARRSKLDETRTWPCSTLAADWRVRPRQFIAVLRSSCRRIPTMSTDKQLLARTEGETRERDDDDASRVSLTEHRCASIRHLTHSLIFSFIPHRTSELNTHTPVLFLHLASRVSSLAEEINRYASISLI